jgi:hypothetical protein
MSSSNKKSKFLWIGCRNPELKEQRSIFSFDARIYFFENRLFKTITFIRILAPVLAEIVKRNKNVMIFTLFFTQTTKDPSEKRQERKMLKSLIIFWAVIW